MSVAYLTRQLPSDLLAMPLPLYEQYVAYVAGRVKGESIKAKR